MATGLLGLSSVVPSASSGLNALRLTGLVLLALAIGLCLQALVQFHRRARLLDMRRSDGFDDNVAPMVLAFSLTAALGATYVVSIFKQSTV